MHVSTWARSGSFPNPSSAARIYRVGVYDQPRRYAPSSSSTEVARHRDVRFASDPEPKRGDRSGRGRQERPRADPARGTEVRAARGSEQPCGEHRCGGVDGL